MSYLELLTKLYEEVESDNIPEMEKLAILREINFLKQ